MAGEDQGEQLVAEFFVVDRLALLGPRLQQQREDVAALLEVARRRGARGSRRRSAGRACAAPSLISPIALLAADAEQFARPGATGEVEALTNRLTVTRSRSSGVPRSGLPSMPKIPAMITSRVIACMRGASANGWPTGQRSISRSVAAAIISV